MKNIILSLFLFTLIIGAGFIITKDTLLTLSGTKTQAVITHAENFSGAKGLNLDYTFKDSSNVEYNVSVVYTNYNRPNFYVGQSVSVAYDKNNPNNNIIVSDQIYVNFMFMLATVIIVTFLIIISFKKITKNKKNRKRI